MPQLQELARDPEAGVHTVDQGFELIRTPDSTLFEVQEAFIATRGLGLIAAPEPRVELVTRKNVHEVLKDPRQPREWDEVRDMPISEFLGQVETRVPGVIEESKIVFGDARVRMKHTPNHAILPEYTYEVALQPFEEERGVYRRERAEVWRACGMRPGRRGGAVHLATFSSIVGAHRAVDAIQATPIPVKLAPAEYRLTTTS